MTPSRRGEVWEAITKGRTRVIVLVVTDPSEDELLLGLDLLSGKVEQYSSSLFEMWENTNSGTTMRRIA